MFFNTTQSWQINGTTFDLETVAIHELGHAIGMGHSTDNTAAMYPAYITTRQAVNADDTSGIRTIYNSRQNDFFDANGSNDSTRAADDISSYIDGNGQLTLSALDSTTPVMIGVNDIDWYKITVPASTTGTMVVRMQSTGLSLLAPTLSVYNCGGNHEARAADFLHHGRYGHGHDHQCVPRPGLRYPMPGLDRRRFGLRGLRPSGEFRLAHPDPVHGTQHHHGRSVRPGRRHDE